MIVVSLKGSAKLSFVTVQFGLHVVGVPFLLTLDGVRLVLDGIVYGYVLLVELLVSNVCLSRVYLLL